MKCLWPYRINAYDSQLRTQVYDTYYRVLVVLFGRKKMRRRRRLRELQIGHLQISLSAPNAIRLVISTPRERERERQREREREETCKFLTGN